MATAQFVKIFDMQGFDEDHGPWQMLPLNGRRFVALRNGKGLTVNSPSTKVVVNEFDQKILPSIGLGLGTPGALQPEDRVFFLTGLTIGGTFLQAKNGSKVEAELDLSVIGRRELLVTCNFVSDGTHATTRAESSASQWIKQVNDIYNNQANIYLYLLWAGKAKVDEQLGPVVLGSGSDWNKVCQSGPFRKCAPRGHHYYFVWDLNATTVEGAPPGPVEGATASLQSGGDPPQKGHIADDRGGNNTWCCRYHVDDKAFWTGFSLIQDQTKFLIVVMAHELGHFLRRDEIHSESPKDVMFKSDTWGGTNLGRYDVLQMNACPT